MSWLNPWALALGALAAGLPIAIHLLTRPRPVRLPLSTIRFVHDAVRQRRARHRLRDALVLGLRTLAVLAIAWAVARPLFDRQAQATGEEDGEVGRVVIFDVSQSLAAQANGVALFERGRPIAADFLTERPGLRANLILAGADARPVFDRLSANYPALREELAKARVRPERLNVPAAIRQAAELLGGTSGRRRELVIVSDFQRSNWAAADFGPLPQDTHIQLESVAPRELLANLAVLRVTAPHRVEQGGAARLEIEVGNFSAAPRRVRVEVAVGAGIYNLEGLCPPAGRTTLAADVPVPGDGWQGGTARLVDVADALADDNARPFVLEIRPTPTFALLTRQPADMRPSSSYYLERALVPLEPRPGRAGARVIRIDPAHPDFEALNAAEVIALDHPGRLTGETIQKLAQLLRRGRGLLYVATEAQDATNLQLLADAAGTELQLPVEFAPPAAGQRRRDLFLIEVRKDQPPFALFGDDLPTVTGPLRFAGGLPTRRRDNTLADDVLASYSDRTACLVATACGAGTLAVLNADLAASNLPGSTAFVPLVGELLGRLLSRQRTEDAQPCGEPLARTLPTAVATAAGLRIVGPGEQVGQLTDEGGGVLWRSPALEKPGVYQVLRQDVPVYGLAAATPPEESDLQTLGPEVFTERLAGGRPVTFRREESGGNQEDRLWVWLAVLCVGCVLAEWGVLKAFRT